MPLEVPRYDEPQVRKAGLPGPAGRQQPGLDSFGGGQAAANAFKAGSDLAAASGDINKGLFDRDAAAAIREYMGQFSSEEARLKAKMGSAKGSEAVGIADRTLKEFDDSSDKIMKEVNNPIVRQRVLDHAASFRQGLDRYGLIYEAQEKDNFDKINTAALVKGERNNALTAYLDPDNPSKPTRVMQAIARQRAAVADQMHGQSKDAIEVAQALEESKTHLQVLDRMLQNGADILAKNYYEANAGSFFGDDKTDAEKMLQTQSILGTVQSEATRIMAPKTRKVKGVSEEYPDLEGEITENPTEEDAIAEARKIAEPRVQKMTVDEIKTRYHERREIAKEKHFQDVQDAFEIVEQYADLKKVPPGLRERLKPSEVNTLEARATAIRRKEEPVTIWEEYVKLRDLANDPATRQKFVEIPPMNYRRFLGKEEFEKILTKREAIMKGDEKELGKMKGYRTTDGIVSGTISAWLARGQDEFSEDKDAKEAIERLMDEEVKSYQSKNDGQAPDNDWVQKKVDSLITEATVEPRKFLPDKTEMGFRTLEKELGKVEEIPPAERAQIEASLRSHGQVPTRRRVLELHAEMELQRNTMKTPSRADFMYGSTKGK